jgi:hypothetical protein
LNNLKEASSKIKIYCSEHESTQTSFFCTHHLDFLCNKCFKSHFEHHIKIKDFMVDQAVDYCQMLLIFMKEIEK